MAFGGFFEVHSILAEHYRKNSTYLLVKYLCGFFDTHGIPVGVQLRLVENSPGNPSVKITF